MVAQLTTQYFGTTVADLRGESLALLIKKSVAYEMGLNIKDLYVFPFVYQSQTTGGAPALGGRGGDSRRINSMIW